MPQEIDLPGLVWTQMIENIRVIAYGRNAEPGVAATLENVKLIGTVEIDGQVFQVDMEAPKLICRRQAPCPACNGTTLELEAQFGHKHACTVCHGRGVK